jgi:hypothetical protein
MIASSPWSETSKGIGDVEFGKMQIVNLLAAFHGHTRLLEISSGTTGQKFFEIDSSLFKSAERLAYNLLGSDAGLAVDFRSDTLDIGECVAEIERRGAYDIIFVDPYHDYACSSPNPRCSYQKENSHDLAREC